MVNGPPSLERAWHGASHWEGVDLDVTGSPRTQPVRGAGIGMGGDRRHREPYSRQHVSNENRSRRCRSLSSMISTFSPCTCSVTRKPRSLETARLILLTSSGSSNRLYSARSGSPSLMAFSSGCASRGVFDGTIVTVSQSRPAARTMHARWLKTNRCRIALTCQRCRSRTRAFGLASRRVTDLAHPGSERPRRRLGPEVRVGELFDGRCVVRRHSTGVPQPSVSCSMGWWWSADSSVARTSSTDFTTVAPGRVA